MDVLKAVQVYINKMITEVSGMKVLLLDAHTVCHITRQVANYRRPLSRLSPPNPSF
jgi:hypothetical protein